MPCRVKFLSFSNFKAFEVVTPRNHIHSGNENRISVTGDNEARRERSVPRLVRIQFDRFESKLFIRQFEKHLHGRQVAGADAFAEPLQALGRGAVREAVGHHAAG